MGRVEKAVEASFSLSVWAREKNCVACGEPGSNAHHVMGGAHGRDNALANGVMLCGSGTTGCHGKFHAGVAETRRAIGSYIVWYRPDTMAFLRRKLPDGWRSFLARVYLTEVPMNEPGQVDAAQVTLYDDAKGEVRWRAQDTNGQTVADSGEGYESREYAEKAATDLFPNAVIRREWEEA